MRGIHNPNRSSGALAGVLCAAAIGLAPRVAGAHVSVVSGNGASNATQEVVFGVGHGCSGTDTFKVVVDIPAGVSSVRPMTSDFGKATVQKDMGGTIVSVTWQKELAAALDSDTNYYKLTLRLKTPDKPFTTVYFVVHQTCRAMDGKLTTVDWAALPGMAVPDGGEAPEPAAALPLVPAHVPGWNKFTTPIDIADPAAFFKDALIVWKGTAAWSANANTTALIKATGGVTALGGLKAGDEFWVKY